MRVLRAAMRRRGRRPHPVANRHARSGSLAPAARGWSGTWRESARIGAAAGRPGLFAPLFTTSAWRRLLGLGFAQGMPFLLVYATQSAWLSEAKVPLATSA